MSMKLQMLLCQNQCHFDRLEAAIRLGARSPSSALAVAFPFGIALCFKPFLELFSCFCIKGPLIPKTLARTLVLCCLGSGLDVSAN